MAKVVYNKKGLPAKKRGRKPRSKGGKPGPLKLAEDIYYEKAT